MRGLEVRCPKADHPVDSLTLIRVKRNEGSKPSSTRQAFWQNIVLLWPSRLSISDNSLAHLRGHYQFQLNWLKYLWNTFKIPLRQKHASDVMTQTRLRQTLGEKTDLTSDKCSPNAPCKCTMHHASLFKQTGMVDDFEDFFKGKSRCS